MSTPPPSPSGPQKCPPVQNSDQNSSSSTKSSASGQDPNTIRGIGDEGFKIYLDQVLGSGGFAKVYKGKYQPKEGGRRQDIAVKVIHFKDVSEEWKDKCLTVELVIQMKLQHPNILKVFGRVKTRSRVFIFMELAPDSVEKAIERYKRRDKFLKLKNVHRWLAHLADALKYMHTFTGSGGPFAHRDLKNENILLNENDEIKLADFGLACSCSDDKDMVTVKLSATRVGTGYSMAPEVMVADQGRPYNAIKADMYSLGVCAYEMMAKFLPFASSDDDLVALKKRLDRDYVRLIKLKKHLTPEVAKYSDLVDRMLEPEPSKRITDEELLEFFVHNHSPASSPT